PPTLPTPPGAEGEPTRGPDCLLLAIALHAHRLVAQQIRGRRSPLGKSTLLVPPIFVVMSTVPGFPLVTCPTQRALLPRGCACNVCTAAASARASTTATNTPSFAISSGFRPRRSATVRTSALTGISASSILIPKAAPCTASFSTAATPPRVASRRKRSDCSRGKSRLIGG